jgi:CRP-like cAMP-binding protein
VLALVSPLAILGDLELFSYETLKTNVVTTEASVLLGIEKDFVLQYGYDDPRFLRFVIHNLTAKLYQTSLYQTGNVLPLAARLATYLIEQPVTPDGVILLPARTHLAGLLGTSPRHLNRVIKDLEGAGLIRRDRQRLRILDRAGLARRADAE